MRKTLLNKVSDSNKFAYLKDPISAILDEMCFCSTDEDAATPQLPWRTRIIPWRTNRATTFVRRLDQDSAEHHVEMHTMEHQLPHSVTVDGATRSTSMTPVLAHYLRNTVALLGAYSEAHLSAPQDRPTTLVNREGEAKIGARRPTTDTPSVPASGEHAAEHEETIRMMMELRGGDDDDALELHAAPSIEARPLPPIEVRRTCVAVRCVHASCGLTFTLYLTHTRAAVCVSPPRRVLWSTTPSMMIRSTLWMKPTAMHCSTPCRVATRPPCLTRPRWLCMPLWLSVYMPLYRAVHRAAHHLLLTLLAASPPPLRLPPRQSTRSRK